MNPSQQIEVALFEAAQSFRDPALREAFLARACNGDSAMRARLDGLLAVEAPADDFFHGAAMARLSGFSGSTESATAAPVVPGPVEEPAGGPPLAEGPGMRIGRYKLIERIGEGGCGFVYLAEQREPVRRRVALKVIRLGMDTESVIARFAMERQALALMDHPNIAHVLDAGATESGRPYFVMELVHGAKITEYCDTNRLDVRQRLKLFIQVCQAIQHAHQKGIIHRDIKPSNIMVSLQDGVAMPKVIDFGIARAIEGRLTDNTMFTACDQFLGTPAYMSPEQAECGMDLDTRSDVYSLGVLLYELLTGRTPFDTKKLLQSGMYEMLRTLREEEPQPPSALLASLDPDELTTVASQHSAESHRFLASVRGDLDGIVLKALAKDRQIRYDTVNALAMDLQRFLDDQPVLARPPSRLYLFRKFVRRNKAVFAGAIAVATALVMGLGLSTWFFLRERAALLEQVKLRQEAEAAHANESRLLQQVKARENISQAAILLAEGKITEADALLGRTPIMTIEPSPEADNVFHSLGEWNAIYGRWKQADEWYGLYLQASRMDHSIPSAYRMLWAAPTFLEAGDTASYERLREEALSRYGDYKHFGTSGASEQLIKANLLLPANPAVLQGLQPLVDTVTRLIPSGSVRPGQEAYVAAFRAMSLGMMAYRQGNFAQALEWNQKCLNYPDSNQARSAAVRALSAMARQQLGQADLARSELAQSREFFKAPFARSMTPRGEGQGLWLDWSIARILQREAAAMVEPEAQAAKKDR